MKKIIIIYLIICTIFISCKNRNINGNVIITDVNNVSNNVLSEIDLTIYPQEKTGYGITCITNILENNVNVRVFPSLDAEIITQLQKNDIVEIRGFSRETSTFNNYTGNWVNILYNKGNYNFIEGWVFYKYVNHPEVVPSPLNFVELVLNDRNYVSYIKLSYLLEDNVIERNFSFTSWENYYVILWGPYEWEYNYKSLPGTYLLNKETLELKHLTYLGVLDSNTGGMNAWTKFTNDFRFIIQDFGTGNDPRGVTAWRLNDMKKIFQGSYYNSCWIIDNTITVIHQNRDFNQVNSYIEKFKEENPMPPEIIAGIEKGLYADIIVEGTFNLDTSERIITGARYILTE